MGERPEGQMIERIDNEKGYYKDNCKWGTWDEQANNKRTNRRITMNGKTQTLTQWCSELCIPYDAIIARIRRGWDSHKALTTPISYKKAETTTPQSSSNTKGVLQELPPDVP